MPFVQGHLRNQPVSVRIRTECAHCSQRLHFEVDSELRFRMSEVAADPLVFLPLVDFEKLKGPSIIDSF